MRGHLRGWVAGVSAALVVLAGAALVLVGVLSPTRAVPPVPARATAGQVAPVPSRGAPTTATKQSPAPPAAISIPALGVTSTLGPPRGLNPDGTVNDAPLTGPIWSLPWWYDQGPMPGQDGSSVILGHVDSAIGAGSYGVFYHLGALQPGAAVVVRLANGVVTRWVTVSNVLLSDGNFPDAAIYTTSGAPLLRLITCGGTFNWTTHGYESATVVTASLVAITGP